MYKYNHKTRDNVFKESHLGSSFKEIVCLQCICVNLSHLRIVIIQKWVYNLNEIVYTINLANKKVH